MSEKSKAIRNILIVDDEKLFLKSLREGLRPHAKKHKFKILTAENGRKAIEVLEKEEVLVLITDIKMPEIDGFKLISHAMNHHPSLPVVVMTAYGSPQIKRIALEKGVLRYLEKPIDFSEILALILELLPRGKRRRIQGVTLPTFLQLLEMEKSTCTLAVASENSRGFFYIRNGKLVEAEAGGTKGLRAAQDMLEWNNIQIELEEGCPLKTGSAMMSMTEVLLDTFRLLDERAKETPDEDEDLSIEIDDSPDWDRSIPLEGGSARKEFVELGEPLPEPSPDHAGRPPAGDTIMIKITTDQGFKEVYMNIPKLNKAIDSLRESLGAALLATDIFSSDDAQSIAGFNSNPAACAIFSQFTTMLNKSLSESKFPEIGRYYLLDLVDKKMVVVLPMGDFQWGILIDGTKAQLGLLLNLAIPKAIGAFEEALAE
ncbi:MAG: response regulator [Candidatus Aminicenantes bacterium]|nr:response regulator [Candidatus Aminicenantes bacterium]